jgi:hypothetical protein
MLRAVTRASFLKRLCAVGVLAGAAVCVLEGLPDAAGGADGGEPPLPAAPETDVAPPAAGEAAGQLARRRQRRWRRFGTPAGVDAGLPATHDAGAPRDGGAARDGGATRDAIARSDAGRDLIARYIPPRIVAPPVVPPPPPPPPGPPSTAQPVTELGFNTCQKIPRGKRAVKINLKPEVELPELIAWISSVTCKSFVLPSHLSGGGKKVTFVTHGALTPDEAYAAFLSAIETLGLTVERGAGFYRIIETSKAKMSSVPVYGFDGKPTRAKSAAGD